MEAAACVELARWLAEHRPDVRAVELDGVAGELWTVSALRLEDDASPTFIAVDDSGDPALWAAATECWRLLTEARRADRHVVTAEEADHWFRESP